MARKRIGQVDLKTGELLEGFVAYLAPRRQNGFSERWFAMAQDALDALMQFTRLEDFRVLMALLKRLDFENLITANQAEIARDLNLDPAQVNRALKRLQEVGAIFQGPKVGTSRTYRLNPQFGWKGSAKGHVKALEDYRQERMKAAGISGVVDGGELEDDQDPEGGKAGS